MKTSYDCRSQKNRKEVLQAALLQEVKEDLEQEEEVTQ